MEAFEKWRKAKRKCKRLYGCEENDDPAICEDCGDAGEKAGWRAALEWYRATMEELERRDIPLHGQEVIEQELEN